MRTKPLFMWLIQWMVTLLLGAAAAVTPVLSQTTEIGSKIELGRLLFHDKLLSGNLNISCATCHHPLTDTGDGLALSLGEGASGLGITRRPERSEGGVVPRIPRNAPQLFALGRTEVTRLFHDGRVETNPQYPDGFRSPAGDDLPMGLDNILAVQAMFPVTSAAEMAGQPGSNPIADAAAAADLAGPNGVWALLAARLQAIPAYVEHFTAAFDDVNGSADISYVHAANAIAAFEIHAWPANRSPYDRYLGGDKRAMAPAAKRGMRLFFGKAGCGDCHSGHLLSDMEFHAIAMPQIGPGKGGGVDGRDDFGRELVTADSSDRYRFRTPPLRNVAVTGPWGHAGAYNTLRAVVEHHLDPVSSLWDYDADQAALPPHPALDGQDFTVMRDAGRVAAIAAANELPPRDLTPREIDDVMDFLDALTDPHMLDLRKDVPMRVPSGLSVID